MLALFLAVFVIGLSYLWFRYSMRHLLPASKMFPGPMVLPFIGNAHHAIIASSEGIYKKAKEFADYYKQTYLLWMGNRLYVIVNDHKDAELIFSSKNHIDKSGDYEQFTSWIGDGLLVSGGNKWRKHRKMLTPAFHFKILDQFIDIFNNNGDIFCEKLSYKVGGKPFNIYEFVKLYALDNICEAAMGISINAQKCPDSEYVKAVKDICTSIFMRFIKIWLRVDFIFNMSKYGEMQRNALKIIHGKTKEVIAKRKLEFENQKIENRRNENKETDLNIKERYAFLDILLQSAKEYRLTDEDIQAEVDTFMFEGHDTISSGISFALYLLAEHGDVQEKVYKEQMEIFKNDYNRQPTFRDLTDMKYLEQVIKESLRLYPSVAVIGRYISEDLKLRDGVYIPKGATAVLDIIDIHRNREVWPNPDEFNPDNFTPEAIQKRHPFAFVPFSAGQRNCIGQRFAMLEMKSALSKIIKRYQLSPSPDPADKPRVTPELVLNSENGIRIKIQARPSINVEAA